MPGAGRRRGDIDGIQQIRVILCLRLLWRRMSASGLVVEDVFRKLSKSKAGILVEGYQSSSTVLPKR